MSELPHSFQAEHALLGAILANNRVYEDAVEILRPDHFADPAHGHLFHTIGGMINRGERADPITLAPRLADPMFCGMEVAYLAKLVASMVTIKSAIDYAQQIVELANRRAIILACRRAESEAMEVDAANAAEHLEYALSELSETKEATYQKIAQSMPATLEGIRRAAEGEGDKGVQTGLAALDRILGALYPSELIIIAGRPAMGKTALATTIATKVCKQAPVAFFSLEMSSNQLNQRLITMGSNVPQVRLRNGNLDPAEISRIQSAADRACDLDIIVDDTPRMLISTLRQRAKKIQRQAGLGLVIVDYLQLVEADSRYKGNKVAEVTEISRNLKILAKELHVPVIALSQLSRGVDSRDNKRPVMSDLRESGAIEQDADTVMFCFRESYYLENNPPEQKSSESKTAFAERCADHDAKLTHLKSRAEIIVGKQRSGPTGTADLSWDGQRTMFGNLT